MQFYIGSGLKNSEQVDDYAKILKENGWKQTYSWTQAIRNERTIEGLIEYAELEQQGVAEADVVIILLPAGRGTHVELGMALAFHKRIYLCAETENEFCLDNTVNFYQLPAVVRLTGTADENLREILHREEDVYRPIEGGR